MSEFKIYPAIDMRGGKCVRLIQGDYNQETVYGDSPFDMAKSFATKVLNGFIWSTLMAPKKVIV